MKRQIKLTSQEETQQQAAEQQTQQQSTHEFATPEELLRHDALHTPVPPKIAHRLRESLRETAAPAAPPWWRRLFGA